MIRPTAEVRVTASEGGPYRVTGPIELLDPRGHPIELPAGTVYLCRCGGSANKPFCDGWTTGLAAERVICARQQAGSRGTAPANSSEVG